MPHDLKAKRVERNLDRLQSALADIAPEIHERFDEYLAVLLEGEDMSENTEKNGAATSMRLPESWLDTADELASYYQRTGKFAAFGTVTRATVLRLALQEGLQVLEAQRREDDRAFMDDLTGR